MAQFRQLFPSGFCGVAKNGLPIYIERNGHIKVDECNNLMPVEEMLQLWAKSYEILNR